MDTRLSVSHNSHIRSGETTAALMGNVVIALIPVVVSSIVIYGFASLLLYAVSVVGCVFFEWAWCKIRKKPNSVSDLSAVVTGLILAANVPVSLPVWMLLVGDFVAIIIVKQLFGGIGCNFANPALVGRIVLFLGYSGAMTNWVYPANAIDALSGATPLAAGNLGALPTVDLLLGIHGGVIGEGCILACVIGFVYLVATKTIHAVLPITTVATVFVCYLLTGNGLVFAVNGILAGGLVFGAVFMATDYVTSPFTFTGKLVYGVGLGLICFAIRWWGNYAEGFSFALLFMNLWVPAINDLTRQIPLGYVKPAKPAKGGDKA